MAVNASVGQPGRRFQEAPQRRGGALFVWMLLPALLAAAVLGGFVLYAHFNSDSAPKPGANGGLAWGGTTLYSKPQVVSWLSGHGASYRTWAKRHPAGVALVVPKRHRTK